MYIYIYHFTDCNAAVLDRSTDTDSDNPASEACEENHGRQTYMRVCVYIYIYIYDAYMYTTHYYHYYYYFYDYDYYYIILHQVILY